MKFVLETSAFLGVSPDEVIKYILMAASTAFVGLVITIVLLPARVKTLESARRRIFRKLKRIEDILIDAEKQRSGGKDLTGVYYEMREDQYDGSDERDALEEAKAKAKLEAKANRAK